MPQLNRDGVNIHYAVAGPDDGPVVLMTHGFGATSYMWRDTVAALIDRYRVVTWDIRGHGRSASPDDPAAYSKDLTLADMAALIDAAGAEQAVLLGHSLGGYLSLAFHVEHAARIRALVLMGTGPGYRNPEARASWNDQAEERARFYENNDLQLIDNKRLHGGQHRSASGLAAAARGILAQHDGLVMEELPRIDVPTLIVVGADDAPFLGASAYMEKRIAGAHKEILPAAGHEPNLDQPETFDRILRAFLDGL